MPAGRQDVGQRLRVFTRNAGLRVTAGCVIEAHGEQLFMGNTLARNYAATATTTITITAAFAVTRLGTSATRHLGSIRPAEVPVDSTEGANRIRRFG